MRLIKIVHMYLCYLDTVICERKLQEIPSQVPTRHNPFTSECPVSPGLLSIRTETGHGP